MAIRRETPKDVKISAKIMRDEKGLRRGFGFVYFTTPEEANKAMG